MYKPGNNEQQLLAAVAEGDRRATELVYRQQYPVVCGWLAKNGSTDEDAADIFQEAMVVLFNKSQSSDFRLTCNLGTYLLAISKNLWYKKLQQNSRSPLQWMDNGEEEHAEGNEKTYLDDLNVHHEREAHFEQLNSALSQIGEPCRSLLMAFYHNDKSMQEIAAEFGYTNPDNAKTQKYKCLTRLKKLFYSSKTK